MRLLSDVLAEQAAAAGQSWPPTPAESRAAFHANFGHCPFDECKKCRSHRRQFNRKKKAAMRRNRRNRYSGSSFDSFMRED